MEPDLSAGLSLRGKYRMLPKELPHATLNICSDCKSPDDLGAAEEPEH